MVCGASTSDIFDQMRRKIQWLKYVISLVVRLYRNNRSHAMNQTKRAVKPNLQKVTVLIDGKPKKVWASARALKSCKVERV